MSQAGLEPIRAGRFFVHTPTHRDAVPADSIALEIDAGRAFGTGQHETTTGCLLALDKLKRGGIAAANILDLGTGTGLLAFAALRLWPEAQGRGVGHRPGLDRGQRGKCRDQSHPARHRARRGRTRGRGRDGA